MRATLLALCGRRLLQLVEDRLDHRPGAVQPVVLVLLRQPQLRCDLLGGPVVLPRLGDSIDELPRELRVLPEIVPGRHALALNATGVGLGPWPGPMARDDVLDARDLLD